MAKEIDPVIEGLKDFRNDAYLAGIIDGEGSLGIKYTTSGGYQNWCGSITVSGTYLPMLDWIKTHYGGNIYASGRQSEGHKFAWRWRVENKKDILMILDRILPSLIIKREQALLLREYYTGRIGLRKKMSEPERERRNAIRDAIRDAIRALNTNISYEHIDESLN